MARYDSELAVIGSLMIDSACAVEIDRTGLIADDFEDRKCRLAFEVVESFRQSGIPFDPIIIADKMARLEPGDYTDFLAGAMAFTTTAANMAYYCQQVKDAADRQRFINLLFETSTSASYDDWKADAELISRTLLEMQSRENAVLSTETLGDTFLRYYTDAKTDPENAYCRTGFADLDKQLGGGMFKSEVYIIGARPGMGKTTLGINIAQNIVNRGGAVLFASLEMSEQQIQAKRISLETGIRYTDLMTGRVSGGEEAQMHDWLIEDRGKPFFLTTRSLTVSEIGRYARSIPKLSCIIVDYIGLVSCSAESRQKPRYEQMTEISAAFKALAKMLRIPVLALCQLNRENTTRSDKRPTMADLRDSGAIEQDAGAIILLHRPEYYRTQEDDAEKPEMEVIELNVAKNRHAEPGLVRMFWHGNVGKITMMSKTIVSGEGDLPF